MPPPYSCLLIGVRGVPAPVEGGVGVALGSPGCQGWKRGIITGSPSPHMKRVKDVIGLCEVEHAGNIRGGA